MRMIDLKTAVLFAGGILLIALFLGLWQWFDQRSRESESSDEDREFFRRQDRRRYAGVGVMVALAVAIPVHSVLLYALPENNALHTRPWSGVIFVAIWLVVCVMIVVLLTLAFFDLLATRQFARRHRRALHRERSKLMLEMIHRSGSSDSGRGSSDDEKNV